MRSANLLLAAQGVGGGGGLIGEGCLFLFLTKLYYYTTECGTIT